MRQHQTLYVAYQLGELWLQRDEISRDELLESIRKIILWIGDDPKREGLVDTPERVLKSYEDFFWGYDVDPEAILEQTFEEVAGHNDIILVKDIRLESHCEHHMVPILGKAHIAYVPNKRVVGISKLARLRLTNLNARKINLKILHCFPFQDYLLVDQHALLQLSSPQKLLHEIMHPPYLKGA